MAHPLARFDLTVFPRKVAEQLTLSRRSCILSRTWHEANLVNVIVWQNEVGRHLVRAAANVGLLAQQREAGHGHEHSLQIDAPQVHEENNLKWRKKSVIKRLIPCSYWPWLFSLGLVDLRKPLVLENWNEGQGRGLHLRRPHH